MLKVKTCYHLYADVSSFFVTKKCKKPGKMIKTAEIDGGNDHIF